MPQGVEIKPLKGKISPEEQFKFEASFCSKIEQEIKGKEILINLRGGKPVRILMNANTIIPNVRIKEEGFDFGGITYGNNGTMSLTIENDSSIQAILNLDLREQDGDPESEGFSCLEVKYLSGDDDSVVLEEREPDEIMKGDLSKMEIDPEKILNEGEDSDYDDNSFEKPGNSSSSRFYRLKIKANRKYEFELLFSPIQPKVYSFY